VFEPCCIAAATKGVPYVSSPVNNSPTVKFIYCCDGALLVASINVNFRSLCANNNPLSVKYAIEIFQIYPDSELTSKVRKLKVFCP